MSDKTVQIHVPLSDDDKYRIEQAAAEKRLSVASWARMVLVEAAQKIIREADSE